MPATGRWTPCSRSKTHSPPGCIRRSATCSPRGRPALLRHHLHPLLTRRTRSAGDPRRARPSARRRGGRHSRNTATTPTDPRISQGSRPTRDRTLSRVRPDHGNAPHQARRTRDGPLNGRPVPATARRTAPGTEPPSCIARRASTVISPTARVRIGLVALVLVAAGCGSKGSNESSGGSGGGQSGTLTLGASLSLTGSLAREGQLTKEGYELCKQRVNAKGGVDLGGRKVKLDIKYQDDASQPDTAAQLVDQFNDQGLKLILGPYGSATTEAAAAVVERNGQVMADSAGADDKIFQKGYERIFAVLSPATEYASSILKAVDELAQPKPQTVAFLSADDGFSKTVTEGAQKTAQQLGMRVVDTEFFASGSTDVSSQLTKVKGYNPDLIIGSVHLQEGVAIIQQANELAVRPQGFGETVAPPTPDFVKTLGQQASGVLGSSQWTPQTTGSDEFFGTANQYVQETQRAFGHEPDYHDAEASAACLAFVLAAQKAKSTDPDKVRNALAGLDTTSFFGTIKFDRTGQNVYKPMAVIQIQNGQSLAVWPKDSAAAQLIWPAAA